jgi:hypothetical protein
MPDILVRIWADLAPRRRRIRGAIDLAKRYGAAAVNHARAEELDIGTSSCRFRRRYVERRPMPTLFEEELNRLPAQPSSTV